MAPASGGERRSTARWALAATALCCAAVAGAADRQPNILLIVADDLGYADVGFHGVEDIPTPHLDALAARGVRFSNGYVSGTWCSPTRAGLLTGRYQQRFGVRGHEGTPDEALSLEETTLADRLGAAGYATGVIGKWHLGTGPEFHPVERGFDEFFGFLRGAHNFWPDVPFILFPDRTGRGPLISEIRQSAMGGRQILRGTEPVAEEAYLTDAFGREAVSFIERHESGPFFLFLSFNAVHTPMQATVDRLATFATTAHPVRRVYNAMTLAMDEAIGAVFAQLRRSGIEEDTLVFFISDNGGPTVRRFAYNAADNSPLRGSKGSTLEGGIRVPFVVSWPGGLPSGMQYDQPAIQLDFLPTALAAAGVPVDPEWQLDGVNLLPYLRGEAAGRPHDLLFWRSIRQMAVRSGDWKLVTYQAGFDTGDIGLDDPLDQVTPHRLYNLARDVGETEDLSRQEPERVAELLSHWNDWNAQMRPLP